MNRERRFLVFLGIALAAACGGTTANPPSPGSGGSGSSSGGGGSGSSGSGGSCSSCATDLDCQNGCGTPPQAGNVWCCISSTCYGNSARCASSGGGGSSSGGRGGSSGAGGSGGTPGTGPIACGMATNCMAPNVCCAGGGPRGANTCSPQATCAQNGDVFTCTGQANCSAGQVCCVTTGAGPMGSDLAVCQATCMGGGGGGGGSRRFQVCQASSECPNGQMCRMSNAVAVTVCQ